MGQLGGAIDGFECNLESRQCNCTSKANSYCKCNYSREYGLKCTAEHSLLDQPTKRIFDRRKVSFN